MELDGTFTRKKFDYIKENYGDVGSWAIWADVGDKPKSNMGDLTILDPDINKNLLAQLNPNIVFVGLNISRRIKKPFANFHGDTLHYPIGQDYKTRFALRGTAYWGGYMTDIIKDFEQKISGKAITYLKNNKQFEEENVKIFLQELADIGANNPTLIAFGNNILKRNFNHKFKILKVPHYAIYISKEKYREQVKEILQD